MSERLEQLQRQYEDGDVAKLPEALTLCLAIGLPIPDWLRDAFLEATRCVWSHEVASWDDVFGKPLKKGEQQAAAARRYKLANPVWQRVMDRIHRAGEKVDKELFERVGEEFGIKGTLAAQLYYARDKDS
jgi:hypothetical protein